jgi:hypothetical protein
VTAFVAVIDCGLILAVHSLYLFRKSKYCNKTDLFLFNVVKKIFFYFAVIGNGRNGFNTATSKLLQVTETA